MLGREESVDGEIQKSRLQLLDAGNGDATRTACPID